MFSFLLKIKRRIKKLLKVQSETRQRKGSFHSRTFKFVLLILLSLLVGLVYPGRSLYDPLDMPRQGEIAIEDVIAPFQITVFKTEREIRDETEETKRGIAFVLDYDTSIANTAYLGLQQFFRVVDSLKKVRDAGDTSTVDQTADVISLRFPLMAKTAIVDSFDKDSLNKILSTIRTIYQTEIYDIGVLPDRFSLPESRNRNVVIRKGDRSNMYSRDKLYTVAEANSRLLTALNKRSAVDSFNVEYYYLVGRTFIQPNLRLNNAEYERRVDEALASISEVKEIVEKNDIILRARQKVNERQERVLREMARILRSQSADQPWLATMLPALARILLVLAAFSALYLFLFYFRPDMFRSNPKLLALFMVFALQLLLVYLLGIQAELSIYLYPVALLPIMVTIMFDAEVGLLATIVLAVLLGIMHRFDFTLSFMTIVAGTVGSFTSRRVRKRSEFFRIMYSVSLAFAVYALLVETLKLTPNSDVLTEAGYGVVNGVVTTLLAMGILPFFESLFGITTDITFWSFLTRITRC